MIDWVLNGEYAFDECCKILQLISDFYLTYSLSKDKMLHNYLPLFSKTN